MTYEITKSSVMWKNLNDPRAPGVKSVNPVHSWMWADKDYKISKRKG